MAGFGMRQEQLAIAYEGKKSFARFHCEQCKEDRVFRSFNCTVCKWHKPALNGKEKVAAYKVRKRFDWQRTLKVGQDKARIRDDKRAYYARLAEESRKKFEGK